MYPCTQAEAKTQQERAQAEAKARAEAEAKAKAEAQERAQVREAAQGQAKQADIQGHCGSQQTASCSCSVIASQAVRASCSQEAHAYWSLLDSGTNGSVTVLSSSID
jgi:membrane protein involved in colicin uptake